MKPINCRTRQQAYKAKAMMAELQTPINKTFKLIMQIRTKKWLVQQRKTFFSVQIISKRLISSKSNYKM